MSARCHYCTTRVGTTKDHIIAKSWGGRGQANLVPACSGCNQDKADSSPTCLCNQCAAAALRWLMNVWPDKVATSPPRQRRRWVRRGHQVAKTYGLDIQAVGSKPPPEWPNRQRHLRLVRSDDARVAS